MLKHVLAVSVGGLLLGAALDEAAAANDYGMTSSADFCAGMSGEAGGGCNAASVPLAAASSVQFFVDPQAQGGNDGNAGTSMGAAFKTICRAQAAVRNIKATTGNITVWLRGGYYTYQSESTYQPANGTHCVTPVPNLAAPVASFGSGDSGGSGQVIIWAPYNLGVTSGGTSLQESPVISGGVQLTSWASAGTIQTVNGPISNVYVAAAGANRFRQLYIQYWSGGRQLINEFKMTRPTYPALTSSGTYSYSTPPSVQDLTLSFLRPTSQNWEFGLSWLNAIVPAFPMVNGQPVFSSGNGGTGMTEIVLRKTDGITRSRIDATGSFIGSLQTVSLYTDGSGNSAVDFEACAVLYTYPNFSGTNNPPCATGAPNSGAGPGYYNLQETSSEVDTPFHYENNLAFLSQPGDWYEDFSTGNVYVIPPSGENWSATSSKPAGPPSTESVIAAQGIMPAAGQSLAPDANVIFSVGTGAPCASNLVSNVQFVGLTFAHSNWLLPSVRGYVGAAAPNYFTGRGVDSTGKPIFLANSPPAAMQLGCTNAVVFQQNLFTQTGGDAVSDGGGSSQNLTFEDNAFVQVAASGLDLTGGNASNMTISSNLFTEVGQDYGGAGLVVSAANSLSIVHNDMRYISSDGIFTANHPPNATQYPYWTVEENVVSNAAQDMNDVGAIYSNYNNNA